MQEFLGLCGVSALLMADHMGLGAQSSLTCRRRLHAHVFWSLCNSLGLTKAHGSREVQLRLL
jgi:hypothetical protein